MSRAGRVTQSEGMPVSPKTKVIGLVAALVVVGGVAAAVTVGANRPAAEVDVATAMVEDLTVTVTAPGRVESGSRGDVFPPVAGTLAEVRVADGQTVRAGSVIAVLDTGPLDLAVAQAEAALLQTQAGLSAVDDRAPGAAELAAARKGTDAAWAAYRSAREAADSVRGQAPGDSEVSAASAATRAAKAAYDQASKSYDALKAAYDAAPSPSAETSLSAAAVALAQAEAAYLGAQATEQALRTADLSAQQSAADAAVEQAHAGYLSAKAQQEKLEHLDLSPERSAARAGVMQARRALTLAEENRAKAELRAPIDGTVLFNALGAPSSDGAVPRAASGAVVGPQTAPFTVVQLDAVRFVAEVDEVDIALVDIGLDAAVRLDALPERSFETTVSEIRPAATLTATGGTVFPVYLRVNGSGDAVLLGMKGDATIEIERIQAVVTVPIEALFEDAEGSYVYVLGDGDRLERRRVEVGTLTEASVEIMSGVVAGERVALGGADELTDGMRVSVR